MALNLLKAFWRRTIITILGRGQQYTTGLVTHNTTVSTLGLPSSKRWISLLFFLTSLSVMVSVPEFFELPLPELQEGKSRSELPELPPPPELNTLNK